MRTPIAPITMARANPRISEQTVLPTRLRPRLRRAGPASPRPRRVGVLHSCPMLPVESISTPEIGHRTSGFVIGLGERARAVAAVLAGIRWPRSRRHATIHAVVLAAYCWTATAVISFSGSGDLSYRRPVEGQRFHPVLYPRSPRERGPDRGDGTSMTKLHDAQVALVPESEPFLYPTVYPPQAAALFAPFSGWSYRQALLLWSVLTVALYTLIVWSTWRRVAGQLSESTLIFTAAAAFPHSGLLSSTARSPSSS